MSFGRIKSEQTNRIRVQCANDNDSNDINSTHKYPNIYPINQSQEDFKDISSEDSENLPPVACFRVDKCRR